MNPSTRLPERALFRWWSMLTLRSHRRWRPLAVAGLVCAGTLVVAGIHFQMNSDPGAFPVKLAKGFNCPAMLETTARNCIGNGMNELVAGAQELCNATQGLAETPGQQSLAAAQRAWINLYLVQKRRQMLFQGPAKNPVKRVFDRGFSLTIVENLLDSTAPVDANLIQEGDSKSKGIYTLEYLLFDFSRYGAVLGSKTNSTPRIAATLLSESEAAERRRRFVHEMALDLEKCLRQFAKEVQSPEFLSRFLAGRQETVNLMAKEMVFNAESGMADPLANYLDRVDAGTLSYGEVEGGWRAGHH